MKPSGSPPCCSTSRAIGSSWRPTRARVPSEPISIAGTSSRRWRDPGRRTERADTPLDGGSDRCCPCTPRGRGRTGRIGGRHPAMFAGQGRWYVTFDLIAHKDQPDVVRAARDQRRARARRTRRRTGDPPRRRGCSGRHPGGSRRRSAGTRLGQLDARRAERERDDEPCRETSSPTSTPNGTNMTRSRPPRGRRRSAGRRRRTTSREARGPGRTCWTVRARATGSAVRRAPGRPPVRRPERGGREAPARHAG